MPPPRRNVLAVEQETLNPPASLSSSQTIARVESAAGKNLYYVQKPSSDTALVELPARFRSTIWIKRGSYVLVDTAALADRENKLAGEIQNIVRDEKQWRKMPYWPSEFVKKASSYPEDSGDEESTVGKMPPSESDDDDP